MKKYIILLLISLWAFGKTKAQSNYFLANSVDGIEIQMAGSGSGLSNQYLKDTSENTTVQQLWFLAPAGYDPANGGFYRYGKLITSFRNLTNVWKKITVYDFTGVGLIRTQNLAPNATLDWAFGTFPQEDKRLDASSDYYWKFENVTTQTVTANNDSKNIPSSNFDYIDVLDNDLNLPTGSDCRLKAGQNLTGGLSVIKDQFRGLKVVTSTQQGTHSFIYEIVNGGTVLGQATASITVTAPAQYCTLAILAENLQAGSQTIHEFTLYSPNAQINPFNYQVKTGSFSGTVVKSGVTPPASSSKETIDFAGLATGTYYVVFSSSVSSCSDIRAVTHVATTDACNTSLISIDKINGTNNYTVNSSFSNVASIKAYLTNAQISVGPPLLIQTNITTPTFTLNLSTLPTGPYFLNIEGIGKFCQAQKSFEHTFVIVSGGGGGGSNTGKLETYTKFIHNYKDNWIIAGKNDYESGRDKFGLQTFNERASDVVWKSFISDFENPGNSVKAKAIIGFRKDTSRNEIGASVGITGNSIILQQRSARSGATNIVATINNVTMPVWIRLTKTGNGLIADYSKDLSMNPIYTEIGRISNAFTGFGVYQKFIGVASAKTDVLASARFQGQLGGNVFFNSSTISVLPPVIASNIASPSSGQSVALTTSTACIAPATNKWYKNSETLSFSAGSTVNVQAFHTDSYYARCENDLNKSVKSNTILFTIGNLVSCNNGSNPFAVATAVYANSNVTFSFNASNLSNATWTILNGSTVIKTSTLQPTASSQTVNSGSLAAGNYIFKLDGISCNGSAQKAFTVAGSVVTPSITSIPSAPVAGDNISMNATGCVGNYNWYASNNSVAYASNAGSSTVNAVSAGVYYYATCIGSSAPSNYINVMGLATTGTGGNDNGGTGGTPTTGQLSFVNAIKSVPVETINGKYSPDAFPTISVVNTFDAVVNKTFPNWSISWKVEGTNFSNSLRNRKTPNIGIPFMFDLAPYPYGGYGQRCVDFVFPQDPNTGIVWASDEACGGVQYNQYFGNLAHTIANFSSVLPFYERAGDGGGAGLDKITEWNGITDLAYFYDQGHVGSERFGFRDWSGSGKANIGLADYDNEGTFDTNKSLAILLGLASKSTGYVFDQYANILQGVYIDPSLYPNDFNNPNSAYPQYTQLINETNGAPNSGASGNIVNNVIERPFWNPTYKISIPSKFSGNRGIVDEPTILPSAEVSCLASATLAQGETYVFNTTGSTRVVNKFGMNANTQHMIARTIFSAETHKWYCVNKLDNRKMIIQAKILCDQQQNGLYLDQSNVNSYITNPAFANRHFNREHSFDIGAFVAFTGCEWNIWDRNNADQNLDGYNGAFGLINLLNQRKTFGTEVKSFVDLKPTAKFLLWTSEISYDNGVTYLKEKANKYVMTSSSIPQRQFITPDGYWGGFLARPENTENTSCILRVMYNGQNYTHTVNANMWETVDYANRNTPLSSLTNDKKDYYYFLIKLSNSETGSTILAPSITSNVNSPTNNQSVVLSSSGCQAGFTNQWYSANTLASITTNLNLTVTAVNGNGYFAKCVNGSTISEQSNVITFSIVAVGTGTVTITEPAKSQYFFSNGQPPSFYSNRANKPAIFTNTSTFDAVNDIVYLQNSEAKYGINLKRGGQLCYASLVGGDNNLIFNGYDGGFQVVIDATQILDPATIQGQTSSSPQNNNAYNTTMGGSHLNESQTLMDYHTVGGNGYYVKFRPLLYPFNGLISEVEIEVTYTLIGKALKIEYKYTSFRTDGNFPINPTAPGGLKGWAVPICFLVEKLNRYQTYTGATPWNINSAVEDGAIPNSTPGQGGAGILGKGTKEYWGLSYNQAENVGFGALNISEGGTEGYMTFEQREKYSQNPPGGVFGNGGRTVMDILTSVLVPNGGNYTKTTTAFVAVGTPLQIRQAFYTNTGH